jgi:hypothetical protein
VADRIYPLECRLATCKLSNSTTSHEYYWLRITLQFTIFDLSRYIISTFFFFWYFNDGSDWCENLKMWFDRSNSAFLSLYAKLYNLFLSTLSPNSDIINLYIHSGDRLLLLESNVMFQRPTELVNDLDSMGHLEGAAPCCARKLMFVYIVTFCIKSSSDKDFCITAALNSLL